MSDLLTSWSWEKEKENVRSFRIVAKEIDKMTHEFTPRSFDDWNENVVEEDAKSMVRSSSDRFLSSEWSVQINPSFHHCHLRLERSLRTPRPVSHLVREAQDSRSSAVDESDESVEDLVSTLTVDAEDALRFLRRSKEFLRHRCAHRRNRFRRIPTLTSLVLGNDASDSFTAFLRLVDCIGDDEHIGVGTLKSFSVGMIFRSCGKNLIEEEWVLEAPLDRLDEERSEIPGVRSSVRKSLALGEVGSKGRLEILQSNDRPMMSDAVV